MVSLRISVDPSEGLPKTMAFLSGTKYEDVLKELMINQETVLLLKDGEFVPSDEVVSSGNLSIVKITSRG
ncbi:MAG: hypothetical protein WBL02_06715 [Methanomethylovorans sp.]|uniref:hypothetical protein n=1 Tax=Methanomethylovorans sp. TaxID=2758717 RepID=UPI000A52CF79|nr:hypothetical protein [Methanomethylovorans sp.]